MSKLSTTKLPFTEGAIKNYLDECIDHWRNKKIAALTMQNNYDLIQATSYIDAFQSVRTSIFGETKDE